jgi:hypothetical protein
MGDNHHWAAEITSYRPSEDAPDFIALVYDPTPGGRKNEDGTTSFSMRFPALILSEYVSDQQVAAQKIADELNSFASSQAEIERLRKALEPFAGCAAIFDFGSATRPSLDSDGLMSWNDHRVEGERGFTVGDLRAARDALSGSKDNG